MNDPHTHKGEKEFKDALRVDEWAPQANRKQSRNTRGSDSQVSTPVAVAPRRQSLLGSPVASRSTGIDEREKKKRRSSSLLMP